ncbi:MAG: precorrin-8X methylmutase [Proteobacteria bacterium]|nr:precorrin-8X methylmutase [Pseudomonadota bacterium]MBU1639145.1 precorrin-8X methylmutase [Pseudomonadota bacterium]
MTVTQIRDIKPQEIEAESFRMIEEELGPHSFSPEQFAVVRRVIHATGDFSFADTIRFGGGAVAAGLAAIKAGKNILTDVQMAASGISKGLLANHGGKVLCRISDTETAKLAANKGWTRSEAAMELAAQDNIGIIAIGNAPTALLRVMTMLAEKRPGFHPDLIIGVPVGFVNAAESKELLTEKEYPFITSVGRKGGTPVAVAMVNALLRLV